MRALTWHGPADIRCETVPDPARLDPGDAIVRVTHAAICGSDLHVYHDREPDMDRGTVMGHEFVGEVCEVGDVAGAGGLAVGDVVVAPFTTACGECFFCRSGLSARCVRGALFGFVAGGEGLGGGQAEFARVPLAATSLLRLPEDVVPETGILLGDVLATGFYCAQRAGVQPGGTYAVVGCGPVGLMAVVAAVELGAERVFAFDGVAERRTRAEIFGASALDPTVADSVAAVLEATDGRGVDAVLEAVGGGPAARLAHDLVRPGGTISIVGVHYETALPLTPAELYDKNLTVRMGRCPARSLMEELLPMARSGRWDLASVFTHVVPLEDGPRAYDIFDRKEDGCVKVMLKP